VAKPLAAAIDTSPIIALHAADALALLPDVIDQLLVPSVVWEELIAKPDAPEPAVLRVLRGVSIELRSHPIPDEAQDLDAGEQHAIALALARSAMIVIDERRGRRVATALGLKVFGTLGVLLQAKRIGRIDLIRPRIERMVAAGAYLSPGLVRSVLVAAGED
jgi:predicted nucleic acid-binding protein